MVTTKSLDERTAASMMTIQTGTEVLDVLDVDGYLDAIVAMRGKGRIAYSGNEDLVLSYGRTWNVVDTDRNRELCEAHNVEMGQLKDCFANAGRVAVERDDLTYVEGFAVGVIPLAHAWLVNAAGEVIDPTWGQRGIDVGTEYVGIAFTREAVLDSARRSQVWGMLGYWNNEYYEYGIEPSELATCGVDNLTTVDGS